MKKKHLKHEIFINSPKSFTATNSQKKVNIKFNKKIFQKRISTVMDWICEGPASIDINLSENTNDICELNFLYRGVNKATDVLSFPNHGKDILPQLANPGHEITQLGSIIICLPVCLDQSKRFKVTFAQETEKMILHGLIHLKGFDHERSEQAHFIMNTLEKAIKKELNSLLGPPNWISFHDEK